MINLYDKSLPEKLSDDIISFILKENLKPGDRLPNESILSEEMGAGRSSIREAMKLLASRNIVTIRQGSGTYVSSSPGIVEDPLGFTFVGDKQKLGEDLLEIRFLLEPPIAARAASNADEEDIKRIQTLCNEVEQLLMEGREHAEKDIEFHTAIGMSSKNIVVPRLLPIINSSIPLFIHLTGNVLRQETIETHREITNAIAAHDPSWAHDAMYLHLVYNRNRINLAKKKLLDKRNCKK
ncbi:HTH-type transcriptional regulator LutR [Clostridiales bacterium CHKCI001]|nr:HTH-type transcriptional regulator LutR [Clostridiales bacterium CHKCI001]